MIGTSGELKEVVAGHFKTAHRSHIRPTPRIG